MSPIVSAYLFHRPLFTLCFLSFFLFLSLSLSFFFYLPCSLSSVFFFPSLFFSCLAYLLFFFEKNKAQIVTCQRFFWTSLSVFWVLVLILLPNPFLLCLAFLSYLKLCLWYNIKVLVFRRDNLKDTYFFFVILGVATKFLFLYPIFVVKYRFGFGLVLGKFMLMFKNTAKMV